MTKLKEGTPFPVVKHKMHETVISDTEYITDLFSSTSLIAQTQFRVASWLSSTFINLSVLVAPYEYYRFDSLEFYVQPVSTEFYSGTQLQTGYWGLSFISDPLDTTPFTDKSDFMMTEGVVADKTTKPLHLVCDVKRNRHVMDKFLYISRGGQNQDIRLTDYGILYFVTGQCMAANEMLGSLYCRYKVSCKKLVPIPQQILTEGGPSGNYFANYQMTNWSGNALGNLFGGLQTPLSANSIPITFLGSPGSWQSPYNSSKVCSLAIFPDDLIGSFMLTYTIANINSSGNFIANWGTLTGIYPYNRINLSSNYYYNQLNNANNTASNVTQLTYFNVNGYQLVYLAVFTITAVGKYQTTNNLLDANLFYIDNGGMTYPTAYPPTIGQLTIVQIPDDLF